MTRLDKINLSQGKIDVKLNENQNKLESILPEDYNWKKNVILTETDWLTGVPFTQGRFTTQNNFASGAFIINQLLDFTVDKKFLPFINVEVIAKSQEGLELVGIMNYNREHFDSDYVEVYGDSTNLIYKGSSSFTNGSLTQAQLDAGWFQESFTKKRYQVTFTYTRAGFKYVFSPLLNSSSIDRIDIFYNTVIHHGVNYSDRLMCILYPSDAPSNQDNFLNISETQISLRGQLVQWVDTNDVFTYVGAGAGQWFGLPHTPTDGTASINSVTVNGSPTSWEFIDPNTIRPFPYTTGGETVVIDYQYLSESFTPNTTVIKNLSEIDRYEISQSSSILRKYTLAGVFVSSTNTSTLLTLDTDTDISYFFTFKGYWLYYDDNTTVRFAITNVIPLEYEGDFRKIELSNLPTDTVLPTPPYNPLHRKWTTITFIRNPDGYPLSSIENNILDVSSSQQVLIKNFKSDNIAKDKYKLKIDGVLVFKMLSNTPSPVIYPVYNDTYSKNATTYVAAENHTLKTVNYYVPVFPNVEYKIRVSILNPYDFGTKNNYDV